MITHWIGIKSCGKGVQIMSTNDNIFINIKDQRGVCVIQYVRSTALKKIMSVITLMLWNTFKIH